MAFPIGFLCEIRKINILLYFSENKTSREQFPGRELPAGAAALGGRTMLHVLPGLQSEETRAEVCVLGFLRTSLSPEDPSTLPQLSLGAGGAAVYFSRALSVLGETREALIGSLLCSWIAATPAKPGGPRSALGCACLDSQ